MNYQAFRHLFESNGFLRQAAKSTLADAIWNSGTCQATNLPISDVAHIVDGGSLLHRVPWTKGQTLFETCSKYVDHVKKKCLNPTSDKHITTKTHKIWDISSTKSVNGEDICYLVPFIHSMTGCHKTSRLFGIGK